MTLRSIAVRVPTTATSPEREQRPAEIVPRLCIAREIFDDPTVAAAILDRLLHHGTVLTINGPSYRMRRHHERVEELRAGLQTAEPADRGVAPDPRRPAKPPLSASNSSDA